MPIPIKPIKDQDESSHQYMDYSFLTNQPVNKKIVEASNKDADIIMQIWAMGEKIGENQYKVSSNVSNTDIGRLKSNGFITSEGDIVSFTGRGKTIITTMTLGENNNFIKDQKQVSYKEILANMSKKGKPGYRIPKFASDNNNNLNLK